MTNRERGDHALELRSGETDALPISRRARMTAPDLPAPERLSVVRDDRPDPDGLDGVVKRSVGLIV